MTVGSASITSTIVNLTKTIIGAGILALPFAYKSQGIVLATITILLAAFTTGIGLVFQGYVSGFLPKGHSSFFNISKITYPNLAVAFDVAIAIKTFGVSVSYLVIVGNLMPLVAEYFGASGIVVTRTFWLVLAVIILSPLTFLRTLDALKYTSIVALLSAAYVVGLVVAHYFAGDTLEFKGPVSVVYPKSINAILQTLPIVIFAYTSAQNMFSAINEMKDDALNQIVFVIVTCLTGSSAIYILLGVTGYLSFGDNVSDNIIANYVPSLLTTFGRLAIVVLVLFSYPLQLHPSRGSIINIIHAFSVHGHQPSGGVGAAGRATSGDASIDHVSGINVNDVPLDTESTPLVQGGHTATPLATVSDHDVTLFNVITVILLLVSFAIAVSVESLELVLSFVGSTGATAISFILPGIFTYALAGSTLENRLVQVTPGRAKTLQFISVFLIIWGVTIFVLCLGSNIARLL